MVILSFLLIMISENAFNSTILLNEKSTVLSANKFDLGITQKIFLQTNKSSYTSGDVIWLKGYLVNSSTHLPDTSSANIYLELWNVHGKMVKELIISPSSGFFLASMPLEPDFPDGNYFLVAYTDAMLNSNARFSFNQPIYIHNPEFANRIDNSTRKANRNFNRELEKLRQQIIVNFYPEGGYLFAGKPQRVAIEITDGTGRGIVTNGNIKHENGTTLVPFTTNQSGLAMVEFIPEASITYIAETNLPKIRSVHLPPVKPSGYSIRAELFENDLYIGIDKVPASETPVMINISGITRSQRSFFLENVEIKDTELLKIPLHLLPTGITRILVTEHGNENSAAERWVFINNHDQANIEIRATAFRKSEITALNINLQLTDQEANPLKGNLAASVFFDNLTGRELSGNLFTYLFLSSELNHLIKEPARYFDYENEDPAKIIDLLMMTLTPEKVRWPSLLAKENNQQQQFNPRYGISLRGMITDPRNRKGISNINFKLRVVNLYGNTYDLKTDEKGFFAIDNLKIVDSTFVEVIPPLITGRVIPKSSVLVLSEGLDTVKSNAFLAPNVYTLPQNIIARGQNWKRPRPQGGTRTNRTSAYGQPDQVIIPDQDIAYSSMTDFIRDKAVGAIIMPSGGILLRGPTSILNQNLPIFIIDGVESQAAFLSANPKDIDRVEIYRGASTAAFGSRGAAGALVAFTKRHEPMNAEINPNMHLVNGLHTPREFTTELFEINPVEQTNIPVTVFWQPNVKTDENGMASFQFPMIPGVGRYRIVIQGISENGKIAASEFIIGQ